MPPKRTTTPGKATGKIPSSSGNNSGITGPASKRAKTSRSSTSGSRQDLASVYRRFNAVLEVRDEWRRKEESNKVSVSSHQSFIHFILKAREEDKRLLQYPKVNQFLNIYINSERHDLFKDIQTLIDPISQNTEKRMYRIITSVDDPEDKGDNRLRGLILWVMDKNEHFSIYALLENMFTYFQSIAHTKPKRDDGIWKTKPSTTLERMMMLTLVAEILRNRKSKLNTSSSGDRSEVHSTSTTSKNKSETGEEVFHLDEQVDATKIPMKRGCKLDKFTIDKSSSQRTGYLIQFISRSWNWLARYMSYKDLEEMVLPYLKYDTSKEWYDVIEKRDEGYMPVESATNFDPNFQPTRIKSETFKNVVELPDNVDRTIRVLIKHYLNDMREMVYLNNFYEKGINDLQVARRLTKYRIQNDKMPERFSKLEFTTEIEQVKAARRQVLGLPEITTGIQPASVEIERNPEEHRMEHGIEESSSLEEDLEDTIRDLSISRLVHNRKKDMVQRVKNKNYSSTIASARATVREYMKKEVAIMSAAGYNKFADLMLTLNRPVMGETQLVLIDPPYGIRRERGRDNSNYDTLFPDDMKNVVELIDEVLRPGGHGIIFCSAQQFPEWRHAFLEFHSRHADRSSSGKKGTGQTFNVDLVPLLFINKVNSNNSFPGRTSTSMQSNAEMAVHLKKNGLDYNSEKVMVNYKTFGYVNSRHGGTKNTIDNVPGLATNERITHPATQRPLRAEQKSVELLKELISRYSQPGDTVVDFFGGTFSTAIAAFSLPQHRFFAGVELDKECLDIARNHAEDRFAQNMCNPNFSTDIDLPDDILEAACRLAANTKLQEVMDPLWKAPQGFPQYQIFPPHIITLFTSILGSVEFFRQYNGSDLSKWPKSIQQRFEALETKDLMNTEMGRYSCFVKKSSIKHPKAGMGLFAGQSFEAGDTICFYFGTLVYHDLQKRKSKTNIYGGSEIMGTTAQRFRDYAIQIDTSGVAFNEIQASAHGKRAVYIVPPGWCIGSYINDYHYRRDDLDYKKYMDPKSTVPNERRPNVKFEQVPNPISNIPTLHSYNSVTVKALVPINMGEELYVDYRIDE